MSCKYDTAEGCETARSVCSWFSSERTVEPLALCRVQAFSRPWGSLLLDMLASIFIYLVYYMVYTVLLAIAGLWCFEDCVLTEEEEYEFINHHRAMPY
ncbi:unnamed protein product [Leptosia nina]|uniref:Uncharacterized protein n=1 Tax=Leptosia nina TaxID=320188 RepID=A0AAV1JYG2_9NEOP